MSKAAYSNANLALQWWLLRGAYRLQPMRWLLAGLAVAIGIALGTTIHTVNHSALAEMDRALGVLHGQADGFISSKNGVMTDEVLDLIHQINLDRHTRFKGARPEPVLASPRLEVTVDPKGLTVLGLDFLRASRVTPYLLPVLPQGQTNATLFSDHVIFVSPKARKLLDRQLGETIRLSHGEQSFEFLVAEGPPDSVGLDYVMVTDIATAQWRFGRTSALTRVDLRLPSSWTLDDVQSELDRLNSSASQRYIVQTSRSLQDRQSNISRAYRVNLNMLALVALMTGGLLVFSSMEWAAVRQRARFGLLACLGSSKTTLLIALLMQGLLVGALGSTAGIVLGLALASFTLKAMGGDLGSGYFTVNHVSLTIDWPILSLLWLAGTALAVLAALAAARHHTSSTPIENLRISAQKLAPISWIWHVLAAVIAFVCLLLPPWRGIPWSAYVAIALVLGIGIASIPSVLTLVIRRFELSASSLGAWLAWNRLKFSAQSSASIIAGLVASFALTCAMATMVHSFRDALGSWLVQVLPAHAYLRGPIQGLSDPLQGEIAAIAGNYEWLRTRELTLRKDLAPVGLLARNLSPTKVQGLLPLVSPVVPVAPSYIAIYVSESAAALYQWSLGEQVDLPLGNGQRFIVSGIWRDFARQGGAIAMDLTVYQSITGDRIINDASLWRDPKQSTEQFNQDLQALQQRWPGLTWKTSEDITQLSLKIFDRSFAVTYALEFAAILVGLLGLATTLSAQSITRESEFAMLRQIGLPAGQLRWQLAVEALFVVAVGIVWGLILGLVIACILVFRVNPVSFHWTMSLTIPWANLSLTAAALLVCAVTTALILSRHLSQLHTVNAVKVQT